MDDSKLKSVSLKISFSFLTDLVSQSREWTILLSYLFELLVRLSQSGHGTPALFSWDQFFMLVEFLPAAIQA